MLGSWSIVVWQAFKVEDSHGSFMGCRLVIDIREKKSQIFPMRYCRRLHTILADDI